MEMGLQADMLIHPPRPSEKTQALEKGLVCFGVLAHHSAQDVRNLLKSLEQDPDLCYDFPIEILIVDNDAAAAVSNDLRELARQSLIRTRYIRREKNSLAEARNQVLAMSQGEFVGFFDSDVEIPKGWIKGAVKALTEHERWAGVSGPGRMVSLVSSWHQRWQTLTEHPLIHLASAQNRPVSDQAERRCDHLPCSAVLFRRRALVEVGGFPSERRFAGEDLELGLGLTQQGWELHLLPDLAFFHYQSARTLEDWRRRCVKLARGRAEVTKAHPEEWRKPLVLLPALWGLGTGLLLAGMILTLAWALAITNGKPGSLFWGFSLVLAFQHVVMPLILSVRQVADFVAPREWSLRAFLLWNCQASYAWGFYQGLFGRGTEFSRARLGTVVGTVVGSELSLRADIFSAAQILSKLHLIEILTAHSRQRFYPRVYVLAGWVGLFPFLLRARSNELFDQVVLVDADPFVCDQSRQVNDLLCQEHRFRAIGGDVTRARELYLQMQAGDLVVNSSLEHFNDFSWLREIPQECVVLLQGADLGHPEHVRPFSDAEDIRRMLREQSLEFEEWYSDVKLVPAGTGTFHRVTWFGVLGPRRQR